MPAYSSIRPYLGYAILPEMLPDRRAPLIPPPGHRSHKNNIRVQPQKWRILERVEPLLSDTLVENEIASWLDGITVGVPMIVEEDRLTGERLTVPGHPDISYQPELRPSDISRLSSWIDKLPLMTVQRTLHLLFQDMESWNFQLLDDDTDRKLFQRFMWTKLQPEDATSDLQGINPKSVVVAFQPPWILSEMDIQEFSKMQSFPPYRKAGHAYASSFSSEHRLWGKLWDTCVTSDTKWFVLTSYDHWVFGKFSDGWTVAFVSRVYPYNTHSPTIVEWLTFWVASASGIANADIFPKVPEPVLRAPVSIPPPNNARFPTPAMSESNWDGKSDDVASSAGVRDLFSPLISDKGLDVLPIPLNRSPKPSELVQIWVQDNMQPSSIAVNVARVLGVSNPSTPVNRTRQTTPTQSSQNTPTGSNFALPSPASSSFGDFLN